MKNDVDLMHRAARASGMEGEVVGCESLGGGCIADVRRIIFGDGASVVLKVQPDAARAEEEANKAHVKADNEESAAGAMEATGTAEFLSNLIYIL